MDLLCATLLGRPGAGKTTVGRALERRGTTLGAVHYVSGSRLLDEYIAARRESWRDVKRDKDSGKTANPDLTHQLLAERIEVVDESGVILLDGFPKSTGEVGQTDGVLPGKGVEHAILLDCPRMECVARIAQRYVCAECGSVSGKEASNPAAQCDVTDCDGVLHRRSDDKDEVVKLRRDWESPVLLANHYKSLGMLVVVDASRPVELVVGDAVRSIPPLSRKIGTNA